MAAHPYEEAHLLVCAILTLGEQLYKLYILKPGNVYSVRRQYLVHKMGCANSILGLAELRFGVAPMQLIFRWNETWNEKVKSQLTFLSLQIMQH